MPAYGRHPTSQFLNIGEYCFLVDCGEGTQMQMNRHHIKRSRINQIFISHLHGDHYFGLIGLITSYHLNKRKETLEIFCPEGLKEIVKLHLKVSDTKLNYKIIFHIVDSTQFQKIFENEILEVHSIPLNHRIPTNGFLFREKKNLRRINAIEATRLEIPVSFFNDLKEGKDFVKEDGTFVKNLDVTFEPHRSRSYAFCSDTNYFEPIIDCIKNVDLLYHESTFLDDSVARAAETYHSTAKQAATIALKSEVKKLLLGHFSAKYEDLNLFSAEAKTVFPNAEIAEEGKRFEVFY